MDLNLTQGEAVIKSWDYGKKYDGMASSEKNLNLTVTTERIIAVEYSDSHLEKKEIPIKLVKSVNGTYKKRSVLGGLLFIFLGTLLISLLSRFTILKFGLGNDYYDGGPYIVLRSNLFNRFNMSFSMEAELYTSPVLYCYLYMLMIFSYSIRILIGLPFVVKGVMRFFRRSEFELYITTELKQGSALFLDVNGGLKKSKGIGVLSYLSSRDFGKTMYNKTVVIEILNELGAIIADNKK